MNRIASKLRRFAGLCFFGAVLVALVVPVGQAVEIVPATAEDILKALGPDARGLSLSEDSLPDLFALTASRIEENPKAFIVEEPYESGRWLGGKVVIEYARDLSYTLVSVYDKKGHRERIYSVRTKYTEHIKNQEAKAQTPDLTEVNIDEFPSSKSASSRSSKRSESRSVASAPPSSSRKETAESSAGAKSGVRYEWSEEQGTYVPVGGGTSTESRAVDQMPEPETPPETVERGSPASSKSTSRRPRRPSQEEPQVASTKSKPSSNSQAEKVPSGSTVWIPPAPAKSASNSAPPENASQVRVNNTTWVERGSPKPAEESPAPRRRKHRHEEAKPRSAAAEVPQVASKPKSSAPANADDEWVPKSVQEATPSEVRNESVKSSGSEEAPPSSKRKARKQQKREAPEVVDVDSELPERGQKKAVVVASIPKSAPPPPEPKAAEVPPPHPTPTSSRSASEEVPSTEDLLVSDDAKKPQGPDTSEGDKWVPKAVPKTAPAPEPVAEPEPVKVASIPKPPPVDNSVENILKMAEQGKGSMPRESETWVPKKAAPSKSGVDLNKELARIREEEKKQAVPKQEPKVRRDVNNPEEGVLPVSTFEKFSGPLYGRHREYERRFYPAKKTNMKVPDHDFYVDEVDRKKEIHNVYFYKHLTGKAPKLVAVDRHEKVSFKGNYDIDKEDKGKISTYD